MLNFSFLFPNQLKKIPREKALKIQTAVVDHLYDQAFIGIFSSLFCASLIFISQFSLEKNNFRLFIWALFFVAITCIRILVTTNKANLSEKNIRRWRMYYTIGAALGGLSWGLAGVILFPHSSHLQQLLMMFMLAGVTAGVVPLSAAIPEAAISFLIFSVLPFMGSIATFTQAHYVLFDLALLLYLGYSIILVLNLSNVIKNSIILKFENDVLLTDLAIANRMLAKASTHDPLTALPNRRFFENKLHESLSNARLKNASIALFYLDLDNFKLANDRYGHLAGDKILLTVTERLVGYIGNEEMVARLGGDELAILVEDVQNHQILKKIAEKIRDIVSQPISFDGLTVTINVSIGISIYPDDGVDEDNLLRTADNRMYSVKRAGGNHYKLNERILS